MTNERNNKSFIPRDVVKRMSIYARISKLKTATLEECDLCHKEIAIGRGVIARRANCRENVALCDKCAHFAQVSNLGKKKVKETVLKDWLSYDKGE